MGRKAQPKDRIGARYMPGPPKRIAVTLYRVGEAPVVANLSTLDARNFGAWLFEAIDTAEADKLALRAKGEVAPKPKRTRPKAKGGSAPRRPSRLKRIEQAALSVAAIDRERLPREARDVIDTLIETLGVAPVKAMTR